jgi:hypothetical protein
MEGTPPHQLVERAQREAREAQLRSAAARERARMNEGESPAERQALVRQLGAAWKRVRERLRQARHGAER